MENVGLVLEGGGMRGIYTSGVLDYFMEKGMYFPYVIGVSMGACNAASYISRQIGRNKTINTQYVKDSRYISYRNLVRQKSIFGMDFIFNEIPYKLNPFDFETFKDSKQKFIIVATDCNTGKPIYFSKDDYEDVLDIIKASSSLPFVSPAVSIDGMTLLDGGISDSVPILKSISDGNEKNVIILTRNKGYRKEPFKYKHIIKKFYGDYNELTDAILSRYKMYNETMERIDELEKQGKVFVIRPEVPTNVSRVEKNREKLLKLYEQGYTDARRLFEDMVKWVGEDWAQEVIKCYQKF